MTDPKEILKHVEEWSAKWLGKDFTFRKYQKETVLRALINILNGKSRNTIINAPTGSGKSITALIITGVLFEHYGLKSYLLVSDTYLHQQYEDAINRYNLPFGNIKGRLNNYICDKNGKDCSCAECRLNGISFKKLMNPEWVDKHHYDYDCARTCKWILDRKKAIKSSVTVMTYQFWMFQLHTVDESDFSERDVVIYDECHKIPDIVQSMCTARISLLDKEVFEKVYGLGKVKDWDEKTLFSALKSKGITNVSDHSLPDMSLTDYLKQWSDQFKKCQEIDDKELLLKNIKDFYNDSVKPCLTIKELFYYDINKMLTQNEHPSKSDWKALEHIQKIENIAVKFEWLFNVIEKSNLKSNGLIREINSFQYESNTVFSKYDKQTSIELSFCSIDESYIIWDKLLSHSKSHNIMMSATVGDVLTYVNNLGLAEKDGNKEVYDYIRVDSIFDFSRSPINFMSAYKMNYKQKDESIIKLAPYVEMICKFHTGQRGLIHTGSYEITKKILENIKDPDVKYRIAYYNSSKEKHDLIQTISLKDDAIIVGPSMIEGVDLPDDLCRFMIILKVPYPSLGSEYAKAKMNYIPTWYQAQTVNQIIQCIGRGVRNENDWCLTYILDGCFSNILSQTVQQDNNIGARIKLFSL